MCKDCNTFHHFHVHTGYSKDAMGHPIEYIKRAKSLGMKGLAITEHGSMNGIVDAVISANNIDPEFKIIAGVEIYIYFDNQRFHLTLIGDGVNGYNNLVRIINAGNLRQIEVGSRGEYQYNRVIVDDLLEFCEDVYVLTGCPASYFQKDSLAGAIKLVNGLTNASLTKNFDGRVFAEGMLSSDEDEVNQNHVKRAMQLSDHCNIPLIITNDVHRPLQSQIHAHRKYIQMNFPMYVQDKASGKVIDKSVVYKDLYLSSYDEMILLCYDEKSVCKFDDADMERIKAGLAFTTTFMNKLQAIKFSGKASLPFIADAETKLTSKVNKSLADYISANPHLEEVARKRVDYELQIINSKGFATYFLMVEEFANVGRKHGVVGKGRGSAAGSLVSYLLGVTEIDPLEYDLLFERFLNPKRKSFPDIDVDLSESARSAIIEYAEDKYNAMPIITNSMYSESSLINDLKRYYKHQISQEEVDAIKDAGADCKEFADVCARIPEFNSIWNNLMGQIRHTGSHAGGIVVIPEDAETLVPTVVDKSGHLLAGLSEGGHGQDLAEAGGVKFDMLGVKSLTAVDEMFKLTGVLPPKLKPDGTDACFELLNENGDISGVFQLSGGAAQQVLNRMTTQSINDITVVTSIARTGARESGTQDEYILRVQKSGMPYVIATAKDENAGHLIDITLDNGEKLAYHSEYQIKLVDGSFKKIADLEVDDEIFVL